ncbi:DUF6454 family protein [Arthrobacter bambusae]|uniref:DUF6454 family protein n=1 Tax=Arthrobacter bambusae TaxID=1338426 RepID=UPI002781ED7E|nr:DUF6454 family protein [Arthrobacter bambusae]MDQ0213480.1 hypothetical protein [Arthrobacter bambusae]MDQ0237809.1 hypothetical protein [Arthrobacter bambusae]
MSTTRTRGILATAAAVILAASAIGGTAAAQAAGNNDQPEANKAESNSRSETNAALANDFNGVDRNTNWQQTSKLKLNFPTYHTEGIAYSQDHIFLSAVQITEPTKKFPTPQNGFDRTPGKGIGHLFVMDKTGNLQKDIVLGEGDMYHPGGIDFDGTNVWIPVAQYRPNSSAIIYRVDATTLDVHKQFEVKDHFGGIVMDKQTGHLVGNTWGSRRFAEWDLQGKQVSTWDNPNFFIDYQDCQYVPYSKMLCAGITNLPQTPASGGASGTYELGGMTMMDLKSHSVIRDVPFQQWSTAGHVATRNPFKMTADGNHLTMKVAPDNGDEGNGTEILTYEATVAPAQ